MKEDKETQRRLLHWTVTLSTGQSVSCSLELSTGRTTKGTKPGIKKLLLHGRMTYRVTTYGGRAVEHTVTQVLGVLASVTCTP